MSPKLRAAFLSVALDYRPNIDAACWFVEEIWPGIRRHRPHETLRLVGRKPVPTVQRLAAVPGVEVTGSVPDVRPYLTAASVVVAPLRLARGVQNKVLEALAMGKATVVSPPALAGLGTVPERHVCLAQTVNEWTDQCLSLLEDPNRRMPWDRRGVPMSRSTTPGIGALLRFRFSWGWAMIPVGLSWSIRHGIRMWCIRCTRPLLR